MNRDQILQRMARYRSCACEMSAARSSSAGIGAEDEAAVSGPTSDSANSCTALDGRMPEQSLRISFPVSGSWCSQLAKMPQNYGLLNVELFRSRNEI